MAQVTIKTEDIPQPWNEAFFLRQIKAAGHDETQFSFDYTDGKNTTVKNPDDSETIQRTDPVMIATVPDGFAYTDLKAIFDANPSEFNDSEQKTIDDLDGQLNKTPTIRQILADIATLKSR